MRYPEYMLLGIAFIILGGFIAYMWFKVRRKISNMVNTPTSPIGTLLKSQSSQGRIVEIKGRLVAGNALLKAPYTDRNCVFFHSVSKDKLKEVFSNSKGQKRSRITHNVTEDIISSELFYVEDNTGRIAIDPQGFQIEAQTVMNKERPTDNNPGKGLFGIFQPDYGTYCVAVIKEEKILPEKHPVYVIGELFHSPQGPFISAPTAKSSTAFLSLKTEETLLAESRREQLYYLLAWLLVMTISFVLIAMSK
ncbi:MAG TPA: GIDE domain-containing protein [Candidatus Rifleibacterium sp.]|nr:GIDE domain-containing protein [Candidatus Rifleibacterium sp.]